MTTSSTANLLYSDTEDALRDSVRRLFADRCPPELVARAYDTNAPVPQEFTDIWRTLAAELGVAGLLVPESLGGAGAGAYSETYRCPHGYVSMEHRAWGQNFEQPLV